jgi:hypothetical protein
MGGHRFQFEGREPWILWIVAALLALNTLLLLFLDISAKYFLPKASPDLPPCPALTQAGVQYHAPKMLCWYADHSIAIQFIILAILASIFVIFRKQVRYIPPYR